MIIELTKEIKVIRPEAKAMFPYSNSVFIDDALKGIIDCGSGGRAYREIPVKEVELALLSHYHFDHVNGVSFFENARVLAGQEEEIVYRDPKAYMSYAGFDEWEKIMGKVERESFPNSIPLPDDVPVKRGFQYIELDGLIKDGDIFDFGQVKLRAIHTPGHSPGHYGFFFEKEGIIFSADIDLAQRGPWFGFECSDFGQFVDSVQRLIDLEPRVLVTSHRRIFDKENDNIIKLLKEYLDIALRRQEKLINYLSEPRSFEDLSRQDFLYEAGDNTPFAVFFSRIMIKKFLKHLEENNCLLKLEDGYYQRI